MNNTSTTYGGSLLVPTTTTITSTVNVSNGRESDACADYITHSHSIHEQKPSIDDADSDVDGENDVVTEQDTVVVTIASESRVSVDRAPNGAVSSTQSIEQDVGQTLNKQLNHICITAEQVIYQLSDAATVTNIKDNQYLQFSELNAATTDFVNWCKESNSKSTASITQQKSELSASCNSGRQQGSSCQREKFHCTRSAVCGDANNCVVKQQPVQQSHGAHIHGEKSNKRWCGGSRIDSIVHNSDKCKNTRTNCINSEYYKRKRSDCEYIDPSEATLQCNHSTTAPLVNGNQSLIEKLPIDSGSNYANCENESQLIVGVVVCAEPHDDDYNRDDDTVNEYDTCNKLKRTFSNANSERRRECKTNDVNSISAFRNCESNSSSSLTSPTSDHFEASNRLRRLEERFKGLATSEKAQTDSSVSDVNPFEPPTTTDPAPFIDRTTCNGQSQQKPAATRNESSASNSIAPSETELTEDAVDKRCSNNNKNSAVNISRIRSISVIDPLASTTSTSSTESSSSSTHPNSLCSVSYSERNAGCNGTVEATNVTQEQSVKNTNSLNSIDAQSIEVSEHKSTDKGNSDASVCLDISKEPWPAEPTDGNANTLHSENDSNSLKRALVVPEPALSPNDDNDTTKQLFITAEDSTSEASAINPQAYSQAQPCVCECACAAKRICPVGQNTLLTSANTTSTNHKPSVNDQINGNVQTNDATVGENDKPSLATHSHPVNAISNTTPDSISTESEELRDLFPDINHNNVATNITATSVITDTVCSTVTTDPSSKRAADILSGDLHTNCEFDVRHLPDYSADFGRVFECYDELEWDSSADEVDESDDVNVNINDSVCECSIEAIVPLYRPLVIMRETTNSGTLRGLLKKPNRPPPARKNRVVFDEGRNEFFDADYIILIRDDCPYDEEDEEPCTCGEHELVRLCCEEGCQCTAYGDDNQTPQVRYIHMYQPYSRLLHTPVKCALNKMYVIHRTVPTGKRVKCTINFEVLWDLNILWRRLRCEIRSSLFAFFSLLIQQNTLIEMNCNVILIYYVYVRRLKSIYSSLFSLNWDLLYHYLSTAFADVPIVDGYNRNPINRLH